METSEIQRKKNQETIEEYLNKSYMVKMSGVLNATNSGGECRTLQIEFATMEQANDVLQRIRESQMKPKKEGLFG